MDAKGFPEVAREGMMTGRWQRLADWTCAECTFVDSDETQAGAGTFDDEVLQEILSLLNQRVFLAAEGSFNVLLILEHEWALLSSL